VTHDESLAARCDLQVRIVEGRLQPWAATPVTTGPGM